MKVLHNWLAEYVPGLLDHPVGGNPDALGDLMTELGLCCEEVIRIGNLDGIVVGEVLERAPHPNADRIQLVRVNVGAEGEPLHICCGATNFEVGDKVPLATLGTVMPGGMSIEKRKLRGELSEGMMCSGKELDLGEDHSGILILDPGLEVGTPITEALGIEADALFDLDLTPNRPDALSIIGVARDIAAALGLDFVLPEIVVDETGVPASELASVNIADPDLCGRFTGRVLSNVKIGTSPEWMQQRLISMGMRPINSVVDISNYVMLEYGQPNHTYDLAKVGGGALDVRRARDGEEIVTLDGQTRTLVARDGVIVDGRDVAVGIAGVMGGAATEISDDTENVLLEAAWFAPKEIGFTSKRLGLRSEASARFEKGVDPELAERAALRIAQLLVEQGATLHPGVLVAEGTTPEPATFTVRAARVNAILGSDLTTEQIRGYLDAISFTTTDTDDVDICRVAVPSWRLDSTAEIDAIEEVARLHGYDNFGKTVPKSPAGGGLNPRQQDIRRLRRFLVASGLYETTPMAFLAPGDAENSGVRADAVVVTNPLVAEESVLRTSLLPGLIKTVGYNATHRQTGVGLFEIGHCFAQAPDGGLPVEWEEVAIILAGSDARDAVELARKLTTLFGLVGPIIIRNEAVGGLHPGRSGVIRAGSKKKGADIGVVGEVDPAVAECHGISERVAYVSFTLGGPEYWHGGDGLLSVARTERRARHISRMPSSDVDLAFVVDENVGADVLAQTLRSVAPEVVSVELFDVFRGASLGQGKRSLAYAIRLQADHTLKDDEIATLRQKLLDAASSNHNAELR
ncbi:MAG: phenylalanine--tRNA ligase subunit beta [Actinobacteria bacterium]|nr:phenylalanine--tRNA ligase subunit beta [Actinomycetota bacterium]